MEETRKEVIRQATEEYTAKAMLIDGQYWFALHVIWHRNPHLMMDVYIDPDTMQRIGQEYDIGKGRSSPVVGWLGDRRRAVESWRVVGAAGVPFRRWAKSRAQCARTIDLEGYQNYPAR